MTLATLPCHAGATMRSQQLRGLSILVVDDDPDAREMMRMFLRPTGALVREAADGSEALTLAEIDPPAAVFCDLLMPDMDGHAFLDRLARNPRLAAIPVVAVSGLGSDDDVMRTCLAGFAGHVVKPIEPATIDAQLDRLFGA